jgi:hypothetical protein
MLQVRALKAPCSYTRLVEEVSHDDDEAKKGKATDDSCDPKMTAYLTDDALEKG